MTTQKNRKKPDLVFWFDAPPRAGAGVFRNVAQEWGANVHYLCAAPLRAERRDGGWKDCDHGKAVISNLAAESDPDRFVRDFVQKHRDAIFVCNGFRGLTARYIKKWLFPVHGAKIALWSERPGVYGSRMKRILRILGLPLLHRYYALRYSRKIKLLLPLGTIGSETFANFGWRKEIIFPFMYDPQVNADLAVTPVTKTAGPLKILYIGRFTKSTKGIDVLIEAVDGLKGNKWKLELVGGYGDFKDFTISWAKKNPNVLFGGTWPSSEVCKRITQFDVCLVPSRFDGWNVVTNEALRAGVGVIISDAAASDDLVKASGAGIVVPAGNVVALRTAIQRVIDNPSLADSWKEKARAYSHKITSESVGRYFMDVLEYTFLDPTRPRPQCPWL
jgi:glycosyltransferase involved in cell wall biosynthesis